MALPSDRIPPTGTSEALYLRLTMLLEARNAYQGASTANTLTFDTEVDRRRSVATGSIRVMARHPAGF